MNQDSIPSVKVTNNSTPKEISLNSNALDSEEKEINIVELLKQQAESAIHFSGFTSKEKSRFIDNAIRYWPAKMKIAFASGISYPTINNHISWHPDFAALMKTIDVLVTDDVELILKNEAMKPKSFLDRIAYLKAHRPELYNPAKVVRVEGVKLSDSDRANRLAAVETFIDADLADSYRQRNTKQTGGPAQAIEAGKDSLTTVNNESEGVGADDAQAGGDPLAEKTQP